MVTGPAIATYRANLARSSWDMPSSLFERAEKQQTALFAAILSLDGTENAYALHDELAQAMLVDCTIERHNDALDRTLAKIEEIAERSRRLGVTDGTKGRMNQGAQYVRHLGNMVILARVIAQGARNRDESRGAHYKPAFEQRDDAAWLRTTLALHKAASDGSPESVRFVREIDGSILGQSARVADTVDLSLVRPRARKYETAGAASKVAS
jgi:succinate dehydrogenase / fumarate reductase flavoprotein subunit